MKVKDLEVSTNPKDTDQCFSFSTLHSPLSIPSCYHCGLPVPSGGHYSLTIEGQPQLFCCPGCQAVAAAIVDGGLGSFYRFRTECSPRPETQKHNFDVYDLADLQQEFVTTLENGHQRAQLLIEGISCAACVWLIEHHLGQLAGVERVRVNADTRRCLLEWRPADRRLSELMQALADIGYQPQPATEDRQQTLRREENRQALMRLGVAGLGMMQVGMVAIGLYAGALQDLSETTETFLRWVSWIIATPVVGYSAQPFFRGAWRVLKNRHLSMDVPVALAIGGAYLASCWATLSGGGEVYFDSVSMFTFFLLLGRYLEMRARHHNGLQAGRTAQLLPLSVRRIRRTGDTEYSEAVAAKSLRPGDWVRVNAGDTFACDGRVLEGRSGVVEALLTGEPDPVDKQAGDPVAAGSLNQDSSLLVEVTAVGGQTQLSAIERLVEQAQLDKPRQVALADRLAGYFVGAVLLVGALVALWWWYWEPQRAFWITLSVLVVTCPCALSLATPTALTAAVSCLRRMGLLVTRGHVVEGLDKVNRVVFDKTGTLTLGQPQVEDVILCGTMPRDRCLAVAAALEAGSNHPIARAFADFSGRLYARHLRSETGAGVEGEVEGEVFRIGTPAYAMGLAADNHGAGAEPAPPGNGQWLLLAGGGGALAWIGLSDKLRPGARAAVQALMKQGIDVELLSGDASARVGQIAAELGIGTFRGGVGPDRKLSHIRECQARGDIVLMVGDGVNDVPVLSGADVSVAMGSATDLARTRADSILLCGDLQALPEAIAVARAARRIIRQNLGWAVLYNGLALPLAAAGWVPPYAAAIGMSLSSLVVVVNALRLGKNGEWRMEK